MPIVGFNFDKTSAQKSAQVKKGMRVAHNMTINSIDKESINLGKDVTKPGLKFSFEYEVKYEPKIGEVIILGHLLYLDEEKKIKEILADWAKNKKIEPTLTAQLINTAIVKSTIKALSLSQDINLPPHLPIPTINPQKADDKAKEYIG
tara:strand:+ start:899 stop:1342 length:444 start_codon:yes stop_codon:yes gene_type:complete